MALPAAVAETPSHVTEIILVFFIYYYYDVINPIHDLTNYSQRGVDYLLKKGHTILGERLLLRTV